jgi:hypothetical protein
MDDEAREIASKRFSREQLKRLEKTPEWMAVHGLITAEQYLVRYGYEDRPIEEFDRGAIIGPPRPPHLPPPRR